LKQAHQQQQELQEEIEETGASYKVSCMKLRVHKTLMLIRFIRLKPLL
jgi:hypothetical protein